MEQELCLFRLKGFIINYHYTGSGNKLRNQITKYKVNESDVQHLGLGGGSGSGALLLELGVFQLDSGLAGEHGTAVGEGSSLVRLLRVQLALVVGQWQRSAVLDQLQQLWWGVLAQHAGGTAAEGSQFPGLTRLNGCAAGGGEAHVGEVCKEESVGVN